MTNYEPCLHCGGSLQSIDWSGVLEFSVGNEQGCIASCTNCGVTISITIYPDLLRHGDSEKIERILGETWNKLYRELRK